MYKIVRQHLFTLVMDCCMSMIDDDDELDSTLENTKLDEFELIHSLQEQLDDSSQEDTCMGIGSAPAMDTNSTLGLVPQKGSSVELRLGVEPCQGSSLSPPFNLIHFCTPICEASSESSSSS